MDYLEAFEYCSTLDLSVGDLFANCIHLEARDQDAFPFCADCQMEAIERLDAVAHGGVALSTDEALPARGRYVNWRTPTGGLRFETFKNYGRVEVEFVLATLAACEPALAHPTFVAQDPNLFWPTIYYHGTVRAALEYVAPYIDWTERLGPVKAVPSERRIVLLDQESAVYPGQRLVQCGDDFCHHFALEETGSFSSCSQCERRVYCSRDCQVADEECVQLGSASGNATTPVATQFTEGESTLPPMTSGEIVVLHDHASRTDLNGLVGVTVGGMVEGLYPVSVRGLEELVNVKAVNLYRLGVAEMHHPGKAHKFLC